MKVGVLSIYELRFITRNSFWFGSFFVYIGRSLVCSWSVIVGRKMVVDLLYVLVSLILIELYFVNKTVFLIINAFILAFCLISLSLVYSFDLLFVTLIIVLISVTLSLLLFCYAFNSQADTGSADGNEFSYLLFFAFMFMASTFFITTNDLIKVRWVNVTSLTTAPTYQVTAILHYFIMLTYYAETVLINVLLFIGVFSGLMIINVRTTGKRKSSFKRVGVMLRVKRLSRRLNTFAAFMKKNRRQMLFKESMITNVDRSGSKFNKVFHTYSRL